MAHEEERIKNLERVVKCLVKKLGRERRKKEIFCEKANRTRRRLYAAMQIIRYYEDDGAGAEEIFTAANGFLIGVFFKNPRHNKTIH